MPRFRKRPIEVEAEQWFPGKRVKGVKFRLAYWEQGVAGSQLVEVDPYVVTIQGQPVDIEPGEWIIQERDGEHAYPCDPVEFERVYERAEEPDLPVRIVAAIEANLKDREGLSWDNLADDAAIQALRDELADVVREVLSQEC